MRAGMNGWNRVGEQVAFYATVLRGIGLAVTTYKYETMRQVTQMAGGLGAVALVGGSIGVVFFINANGGAIVNIFGYDQLSNLGVESLVGFFSAYASPRLLVPFICVAAIISTVGAGVTAQLGAMRINEEIDGLEAMSVFTIPYLCSTRVVAGMIVVIPLYCSGMLAGFVSGYVLSVVAMHQSAGSYTHYFRDYLRPMDSVTIFVQVIFQVTVIMLIHAYYGYNASGGPAGVGEATGRAVRLSLGVNLIVGFMTALALFGRSGGFHLSG
ncbi:ABC transporter permease [Mycobacterium heckeshornense]|uniref:ABC transporter permease n=1 Tax=Mycobacterium heckeshornense TaxID=110505 RepID=A0A7R7JI83_9MYCO|nr:ABC transporter permease [Mycobacterium heckeshornense]MCV7035926.1 ABC transporter permease [Mycobacterium heckeshornense]BCO36333.1 ABC transporter permease [Mycobacterium heckeshornense]